MKAKRFFLALFFGAMLSLTGPARIVLDYHEQMQVVHVSGLVDHSRGFERTPKAVHRMLGNASIGMSFIGFMIVIVSLIFSPSVPALNGDKNYKK